MARTNPIGAKNNAADETAEAILLNALNLERLKAGEVKAVVELLEKLAVDIEAAIKQVDPSGVGPSTYRQRRMAALLQQINATTADYYGRVAKQHEKALKGIAAAEAKATVNAVNKAFVGVPLAGLPTVAQLSVIASDTLIEGAPSKEWWAGQKSDLQTKFKNEIRQGMLLGESSDELVRRIRGTKANNFKDGILNVKKHQAEALVRTSVQAVSHAARMLTYNANDDLFKGYQWLSTLDGRTSDLCKARSGLTWDKDFNPVGHDKEYSAPPAHWNCRSAVVPWIKDWADLAKTKQIADKVTKRLGKDGTLDAFFVQGLIGLGKSKDEAAKILRKTQASMDGQVPADINFEQWLKTKGEGFQLEVLGPARYQLFKDGKISLLDLVDQSGNPITLQQLQKLVDEGKSALIAFSPSAQKLAKEEAAAKAAEDSAVLAAEAEAAQWLDDWPTQAKGKAAAFTAASKKDGWATATKQQRKQMVLDTFEQAEQAQWQSIAAGKIVKGKKLSPKEKKYWSKADADYKAAKRAEAAAAKAADDAAKAAAAAKAADDAAVQKASDIIGDKEIFFLDNAGNSDTYAALYHARVLKKAQEQGSITAATLDDIVGAADSAEQTLIANINAAKAAGVPDWEDVLKVAAGENTVVAWVKANNILKDKVAEIASGAAKELELVVAGGKGYKSKQGIYQKLAKQDGFEALPASQQLAQVNATYAANQLQANLSIAKGKLAQGKKLGKVEQDAVNTLEGAALKDFMDQVADKKVAIGAKAAKEAGAEVDVVTVKVADDPVKAAQRADGPLFDDLEQVGGQGGSNTGGLFKSAVDGNEYYVKAPKSALHAKVEVLSAKLYDAAGVRVPQITPIRLKGKIGSANVDGQLGVASKIEAVDDITPAKMQSLQGAGDGFATDVWLANWDVIGNGAARELNMKLLKGGGGALRIDTGGTLFLRAQGGRKTFGAAIDELDSLRDPRVNGNAAQVFGELTDEQIAIGVQRIVAISDDDIRRLVAEVMEEDAGDLAEVLIARKNLLAERFKPQLEALAAKAKRAEVPNVGLAPRQHKDVLEGRVNGYTIPSDKDLIEDQQLHLWTYKQGGKAGGGINFKVRGELSKKLSRIYNEKEGSFRGSGDLIDLSDLDEGMSELLRGIGALASKGEVLRGKDASRFMKVRRMYAENFKEIKRLIANGDYPPSLLDEFEAMYDPWMDDLQKLFSDTLEGETFTWAPHTKEYFKGKLKLPKPLGKEVEASDLWVVTQRRPPKLSSVKNGNLTYAPNDTIRTDLATGTNNKVLQYKDDFIEVNYIPNAANRAWQDTVDVRFVGSSIDDFNRALNKLTELGFDVTNATELQQEVLYLSRLLYVHTAEQAAPAMRKAAQAALDAANDLPFEERLEGLRKAASKVMGVDDITATPMYDPTGAWEYWGNGRHLQMRPDLYGKEWDEFSEAYRIYHDFEYGGGDMRTAIRGILDGGGVMAPTTDKVRRGLKPSGASPVRDQETGGASYVFTRIRNVLDDGYRRGIYFKPNALRRLDAISYNTDYYGRTTGAHVTAERGVSIKDFIKYSRSSNNETIFKNSLSIFEDVDRIVAGSKRDELIQIFKDAGYKKWPDGRALEEVIVGG